MQKTAAKKLEFTIKRTIPASPEEAFDAWLNPKIPGTPWYEGDKVILDAKVDGLFYWLIRNKSHYGLFTEMNRPSRIQNTWVSPHTLGEDSIVRVTFEKKGNDTLMTLVHSGLPDNEQGKGHEKGWGYFMSKFANHFGANEHVENLFDCN